MKRIISTIIGLWIVATAYCQVPIGEFRCHIPMRGFHSVAASDDYIYSAASNGLQLLERSSIKATNPTLSVWSKVDGLSDIDITKIEYVKDYKSLIICYDNGNIDIIKDYKIHNIVDVKNKKLTASKKINHIRYDDGKLYLVYPFGVVIMNLDNLLIEDTWFTKRDDRQYQPSDITFTQDEYVLSTDMGIFRISKKSHKQSNFQEWQQDLSAGVKPFNIIVNFDNTLFANYNCSDGTNPEIYDTVYACSDGEWMPSMLAYYDIRDIAVTDTEMAICNWESVEILNRELTRNFMVSWYKDYFPEAKEVVLEGNLVWVADNTYGLIYQDRINYIQKQCHISGPFSYSAESFSSHNGIVAVVPGSRKGAAYSNCWQYPAFSYFKDQTWYYNDMDFKTFEPEKNVYDLTNIIINPQNEREWFIASWGSGLYRLYDQKIVEHFTPENSTLDSTDEGSIFVSGLAFDSHNNLWMTNSSVPNMLKMREPNGTWHKYNITSGVQTSSHVGVVAEHLLVDSRGYKWINFPRDDNFNKYHLVAFTESGTYDNPGDDKIARIDMNMQAEVNSSTVYCIAEDNEGEIWIGTDKGIKVITNPTRIFDGNVYPRNILLKQDGYVSVLFEFEEITAIAVDGANRKWIGTSKAGVFLMSEDGQEQLLHFTAEHDPIFSNQITSIHVDNYTGEVFFGTSKGIVSYHGTATGGSETYDKKDLLVYPNPVRHDYYGPVAVKGLKANSLCKITDSNGRLVWQGYSNGGELIWNCVDHFGKRPATGVYYVMISDEEGQEKIATKFLFIQ